MKALRPLDKTLLATAGLLWALCFGFGLKSAVRPIGFPPVFVSAPADAYDYPTLVAFRPYSTPEDSTLRVGDRLIRLADVDLRGVSPVGFFVRFVEVAPPGKPVSVAFERAGTRAEGALLPCSTALFRPLLVAAAVFALGAALLLLRAPPSPMVRAFFLAFMCPAFLFTANFGGSRLVTYLSLAVHITSMTLVGPLSLRALLSFPSGKPPPGQLARLGPWFFAALGPLHGSHFGFFLPPSIGLPAVVIGVGTLFATMLAVVTHTYQRTDAIGRRQIRWFLFGLYCATVPPLAAAALATIDPRFTLVYMLSLSALASIPLSLLVSVARFNLFDVDRLISTTAAYNILLALAVGGSFLTVPHISEAGFGLIGIDRSTAHFILSLGLAAAIVPMHRYLRPRIDRLFFRERYAFDQGVQGLLIELSACEGPTELTQHTGESLGRLVRPDACVVYGRAEKSYVPIFIEGRAVPPAFDLHGPLIATLRQHHVPIALGDSSQRGETHGLSPFDRAALETLSAAVVVPVRRKDTLLAFLCLGRKRSGDVYTPTDLALLTALANKLSAEFLRFKDDEIIRQGQAMQAALRRYVPTPVADQLARWRDLESGEQELSVLFVDIRGYTTYSETRSAEAIFSVVNRYTDTVARVLRQHGGTVVEFSGDGVMAIFGVPEPLPAKERAAVAAARQIVAAVGSLDIKSGELDDTPLSVGVGIATGKAYVGSVQALDRLIWTAIGNTTNLAARLQGLTRDFNAAIAIDSSTWQALVDGGVHFEQHGNTPIRGRRQPEDVYTLPAAAAGAPAS